MTTVTIQEAQSTLTDLVHRLSSGEEVVITENDHPVARLVHTSAATDEVIRLYELRHRPGPSQNPHEAGHASWCDALLPRKTRCPGKTVWTRIDFSSG